MTDSLPPPREAMDKLLSSMGPIEASDLHLKVGYPPSAPSHLDFGIDACQFGSGVVDLHLPIDTLLLAVHVV